MKRDRTLHSFLRRLLQQRLLLERLASRLGGWQELGGVLLLLVTLETAVLSIEQAHWITPQPSLSTALIIGVLTTFFLTKARLPGVVRHLLAALAGIAVIVWQSTGLLMESEQMSRVSQLVANLYAWWQTATMGLPNADTTHFAVFLVLCSWLLGYVPAWFYAAKRNAWVAVIAGAVTILVNLSNLTEKHYLFFFGYLLAAALLVGYTSLVKRHLRFQKHGAVYPARSMVYVMISALCISLVMTSLVWAAPSLPTAKVGVLSDAPFRKNVDEVLSRFLSGVAVQQPYLSSAGQKTLSFIDPIDRSYTVHFLVLTRRPFYWRTGTYSVYTSRGWTNAPTTDNLSAFVPSGGEAEKLLNRGQITHTVIPKVRTDLLPAAGEFISADTSLALEALAPAAFNISLVNVQRDSALPQDAAGVARNLRTVRATGKTFTLKDIRDRIPEDLVLTSIGDSRETPSEANFESLSRGRRLTSLDLARKPGTRDIVSVASSQLLNPDQRIRVTAGVSTAMSADLAQAAGGYPTQVTDHYLQLPPGLPERVRQLAREITKEAGTPYLKALAIKNYLNQFAYNVAAENPPGGTDGVDYFLFSYQEGNCFYFASAMAVMLRSLGVPARLVAGYLPGEWDESNSMSVVRAKDYHAWVDVYIPRYGWTEFDPTPVATGGDPTILDDELLLDEVGEEEDLGVDSDGGITFEMPRFDISLPSLGIPVALLVAVLALAVYVWQRYFAGLDFVSGMYARMCFFATLARVGPRPYQTPLEYGNRLASVFPSQAGAINDIAQTYTVRRFGAWQARLADRNKLKRSWGGLFPALLKKVLFIG